MPTVMQRRFVYHVSIPENMEETRCNAPDVSNAREHTRLALASITGGTCMDCHNTLTCYYRRTLGVLATKREHK